MVFNSFSFLVFFPVVLVLYYIIPQKLKNTWLLLSSYYFYSCWNTKYCLLLLVCTLVTYFAGLFLDTEKKEAALRKTAFWIALLFILGLLGGYKYTNFIIENLNKVLRLFVIGHELHRFDIVLPVGISFFTFQAASYLIDVYKGKISAEKNPINYALFVSFFPQLLSGPIGRADKLLPQYRQVKEFRYENVVSGFVLMVWGFFLKLVIADRAAILVNTVYGDFRSYSGLAIVFATMIYGVQIYCDFYGYSSMATGAAEMLGIQLPINFDTPYLSTSIKEFWRRWHISLSSWLRDYVYFPLGGSRCSVQRRYLNVLVTFFVSGIWHGSKWSFIAWGLLHGLYQVVGDLLKPIREKLCSSLQIRTDTAAFKAFKVLVTFGLADFAWLFFRADSFKTGLKMCKRILLEFHPFSLVGDAIYKLGLDQKNLQLLVVCILVLFVTDMLTYRGVDLRKWFLRQNWLFREITLVSVILFIILVGAWGNSYNASSFIYFQF